MSNDEPDPEAAWRAYLAEHIANGALDEALELSLRRIREQLGRAITAVNLLEARNPDLDATTRELLTITKIAHADMVAFITTHLVDILLPRMRQAANQNRDPIHEQQAHEPHHIPAHETRNLSQTGDRIGRLRMS